MEERWTADQVLALAPDAASRKAGTKLAAPGPWSGHGTAVLPSGGTVVWGLCKGSGSKPYQAVVDVSGPAYKCSCPSRKFPCKHALGLLLLWSAGAEGGIAGAEAPDWVTQWCEGRKTREEKKAAKAAEGPADPAAARRRAERRARRVAEGARELEQRLADELRAGLAGADERGYRLWDEVAARMVDAQAPGLAARVRELASVPSSGDGWPSRLLEEYGLLHLLGKGYGQVDRLPEPLAATVRSRVGFTTDTAELLRGPTVRDRWLVLGQEDTSDDKLTTRRVWLRGERSARVALLLSFGAAGRAPELVLPTGLVVDADLAYHPAARPLRAVLGERHGSPAPAAAPPGGSAGEAMDAYAEALRDDPWLEAWPVVLEGVVPIPGSGGWQLADGKGDALPVYARGSDQPGLWKLAAVSGGHPVTVFGECGHRGFRPRTVWGDQDEREGVAL